MDQIPVEKMAAQVALEEEMLALGVHRFREREQKAIEKGAETRNSYGRRLMESMFEPMHERLLEWIEENDNLPRRRPIALKYIKRFDPSMVTAVTLRWLLDKVSVKAGYTVTATSIARALETEERVGKFEAERAGLFKHMRRDMDKRGSNLAWQRTVFIHAMGKHKVEDVKWPLTDKLHVGKLLIELAIEATGAFERTIQRTGPRPQDRTPMLQAKPSLIEACRSVSDREEMMSPAWMPTIVPPRPWTNPQSGGYWVAERLSLVKVHKFQHMEEMSGRVEHMPDVYDAINTVQEVPWRINSEVLEVAEELWDRAGGGVAGLPSAEDLPLPAKTEALNDDAEALKRWKREAAKTYERNAKLTSRRLSVIRTLSIARKFSDEETIYFPHQYDFRGRMYAVPRFLNPQGDDLQKGLLTFAEGKPIEDLDAARWLAVHGANCFGVDKVSFEDRWEWVENNHDEIILAAYHPIDYTWWMDAEDPFQFLAFCIEWADFQAHGFGYVSHIPVALDGSCNGLQHFSAMLRDPIGGAATNLMPCEEPADIYQRVADVVTEKLQSYRFTAPESSAMCNRWLSVGITRKTVKRPVMVLPYGGTPFSCRQYLEEWLREHQQYVFGEDEYFKASKFLADVVWNSIGEVVVAARAAMDWIQTAAKAAAKEGLPLTWDTPDGFPVNQAYTKFGSKRVKTKLGETLMYIQLRVQKDKDLDVKRQGNGASPNFVHSMDATAMRSYVMLARENGVTSFGLVHDSFATHAADTEMSAACIRQAFVDLYMNNRVLEDLREALVAVVDDPESIPPVPSYGDLDLEATLQAPYFFA